MKIYGRQFSNDYYSNDLDLPRHLLCSHVNRSKGALKRLASKTRRRIAGRIVQEMMEEMK